MKTKELEQLYVQRIIDGDESCFAYFINAYKDMAYTLTMSIVKHDEVAKEVVQDAFLKAYRGLPSFKRSASFKTWFYRIVVNEGLMRYKKIKKEIIIFNECYDYEIPDPGFEEESGDFQDIELMKEALLKLEPRESLVIRLYYLEEQDIKTVAIITGFSPSNVKVILYRARKNLSHLIMNIKTMK